MKAQAARSSASPIAQRQDRGKSGAKKAALVRAAVDLRHGQRQSARHPILQRGKRSFRAARSKRLQSVAAAVSPRLTKRSHGRPCSRVSRPSRLSANSPALQARSAAPFAVAAFAAGGADLHHKRRQFRRLSFRAPRPGSSSIVTISSPSLLAQPAPSSPVSSAASRRHVFLGRPDQIGRGCRSPPGGPGWLARHCRGWRTMNGSQRSR